MSQMTPPTVPKHMKEASGLSRAGFNRTRSFHHVTIYKQKTIDSNCLKSEQHATGWQTVVWDVEWGDAANVGNKTLEHLWAASTQCTRWQIEIQALNDCIDTQPNENETVPEHQHQTDISLDTTALQYNIRMPLKPNKQISYRCPAPLWDNVSTIPAGFMLFQLLFTRQANIQYTRYTQTIAVSAHLTDLA